MEGTAIKTPQWENGMTARFAEGPVGTTACADSLATVMLGGSLRFSWETIPSPEIVASPIQQKETEVRISTTDFEFFIEAIDNPPAPNSNLIRLMRSNSM